MSWEWSHTNEAYENARDNLFNLPESLVREIWREWQAYHPDSEDADSDGFSESAYAKACDTDEYVLAMQEEIWDRASENATCDNGGFSAWMCPFGCGPHKVSFDPAEEG